QCLDLHRPSTQLRSRLDIPLVLECGGARPQYFADRIAGHLQVPCNLPDGLALDEMLAPNSADRLHCQHSPSLSAPNRSKQRIRPIFRGSILDADRPAQGVKIARRITLNMIAARLSPGAISESSSSHLLPSVASKVAKPVTFPLGRSSRATMRWATGSATFPKTIGIVRVCCWTATVAGVPFVAMMSGCKATNSCACARIRLSSPPPQRRSIRTLRPSVQPKLASA